jgi:folate-binding protein YgfZ
MNPQLAGLLQSQGASLSGEAGAEVVQDFGDAGGELRASLDGSVMVPLSHLGVLHISGEDALEFLQGQLSSDVKALKPGYAHYSAYCSAKGRVLADFLLWRDQGGDFMALLSRDLTEKIRRRLGMFVLRARVKIQDVSAQFALLGLAGADASATVDPEKSAAFSVVQSESGYMINLGHNRYLAVLEDAAAVTTWTELARKLRPAGEAVWRWLDIRAGIPWVSEWTDDEFVPQMANLDLIGAVNFQKGCYPGQEIVARTQYLGKLKRRLYRLHAPVDIPPAPATSLYSTTLGEQACGTVVDAAPAPDGGCDLLAVVQIDATLASRLHLGSADGPVLSLLGLPYAIPQAA